MMTRTGKREAAKKKRQALVETIIAKHYEVCARVLEENEGTPIVALAEADHETTAYMFKNVAPQDRELLRSAMVAVTKAVETYYGEDLSDPDMYARVLYLAKENC